MLESMPFSAIPLQREFYNANPGAYTKERTVVIISDAMRYEVGQELFARMQDDPEMHAAKLSGMKIVFFRLIRGLVWRHFCRIRHWK